MLRRVVLTGVIASLLAPPAEAQESWLGKEVFWKSGAVAKSGQQNISIDSVPFPAKVEQVEGELLRLGKAWVHQKDVFTDRADALADCNERLRIEPNARLYNRRGAIWRLQGQLDTALADYEAAIKLDPTEAAFFYNRGAVQFERGQPSKALADYNEAIRLDPRHEIAYVGRAVIWNRQGKFDQAVNDFGQAIECRPTHSPHYNNRGNVLLRLGKYDEAITDYSEAIRLNPQYVKAYNNRGSAWRNKRDWDKALADYDAAIKLDSKFAVAYCNRGHTWADKGQYQRALDDYQQAVKLDANDDDSWTALARLQAACPDAKFRDGAAALTAANKAGQLSVWKEATDHENVALAQAENGDFDAAIRHIQRALDMDAKAHAAIRRQREEMLSLFRQRKPFRDKD